MDTFSMELFRYLARLLKLNEGQNFFMFRLPSTKTVQPQVWWLIPQTQSLSRKYVTEEQDYLFTYILNFRDQRAETVDRQISRACEIINNLKCFRLPDYQITYCHASVMNANEDLDAEDMMRGSIIINLRSIGNILEHQDESP